MTVHQIDKQLKLVENRRNNGEISSIVIIRRESAEIIDDVALHHNDVVPFISALLSIPEFKEAAKTLLGVSTS